MNKQVLACITSEKEMYDIHLEKNWNCMGGTVMTLNKWHIKWHSNGALYTAARQFRYYMYYTVDKRWPDKRDIITILYEPTCKLDTFYKSNPNWVLAPVGDWNTPPGFINNGYFHFFDTNKIYIFNAQTFNGSQIIINSTLITIPAKEFFICNHHEHFVPITYPPITTPDENGKTFFF